MPDLFAGTRVEVRMPTRPRVQVEQPVTGSTTVYSPAVAWRAALAAEVAKLVRFRDTDGNVIAGKVVTITVDTDTDEIADIIVEDV
jgi:hypothetical protein